MLNNQCDLAVLVKGRRITEFPHAGQVFIEGRGGSPYEIEFQNRNPFRVEVILSVDGLSVTDGNPAGPASHGYVVGAYATLRVPGWTLDQAAVAAFTFAAGRGTSYVEQSTGSDANKGVVGALVYRERPPVLPTMQPWANSIHGRGISLSTNSAIYAGVYSATSNPMHPTATASAASATCNDAVPQSLGTSFGQTTQFQTQTVSFGRGDMLAQLALYYDDLRGLKARGVPVSRPRVPPSPQPFPALQTGCKPPYGWCG